VTDLKQTAAELEQRLQASLAERDELLLQQAATAEILKVINSSPGSLTPVFDIILEKAHSLCDVTNGSLELYEGDIARSVATRGMNERWEQYLHQGYSITEVLRPAYQSLRPGHVVDMLKIAERFPDEPTYRAFVEIGELRTFLALPLVKNGIVFGRIVAARAEVRPFTDRQIALLQSFADQAVIAIENARLFNETKEALEKQTATADILRVISDSPTDVQPVFQAIAEHARLLCKAQIGATTRLEGDMVHLAGVRSMSVDAEEAMRSTFPMALELAFPNIRRAIIEQAPIQIPDVRLEPGYPRVDGAQRMGFRSIMSVPLMHEGRSIGTIGVAREEPGLFPNAAVSLLQTFADQAVIAIENVRLYNETKEALERQTATADILKVIASSPSDVQPVFDAIAERSTRLVDALSTTVFRLIDGVMHLRAFTPTNPEADAALKTMFPAPLSSFSWGEAVRKGEIFRVVDTELEMDNMRDLARLRGFRSMLFVPLLRGRTPIGLISVTRVEPGPFIEHHVQLLQTFADQAVIAISNVQLFQQVQERTRELSASLDDLRAAQDRLVQTEKLASLGQLTAGIAHEIKNPLNFVNNFSALSAELVGEMNDVLAEATLDKKTRGELDELAQMLKTNLEKVVQHGKRADSIVKNMLLHSREGSGEHRPVDINAIVDESLNLAYHGARAEKSGFNITMQRDFDPAVGMTDVYPQEITRVLLNLISNGFYATTKRAMEAGDDFKPMLSAATKNLGDKLEIRIRDNGTGIPAEVKEKIFHPFFTTKPAGEGTGLGLSMSHDIIVKQHGGTIEVETEPGQFTEFRIILPRTSRG
jgi:two-component system NtrC family sensor kinase